MPAGACDRLGGRIGWRPMVTWPPKHRCQIRPVEWRHGMGWARTCSSRVASRSTPSQSCCWCAPGGGGEPRLPRAHGYRTAVCGTRIRSPPPGSGTATSLAPYRTAHSPRSARPRANDDSQSWLSTGGPLTGACTRAAGSHRAGSACRGSCAGRRRASPASAARRARRPGSTRRSRQRPTSAG